MQPLSKRFYQRDAVSVARDLLGRLLVHGTGRDRVVGRIVETEGYAGPGDKAAHVAGGRRTPRTEVFWQPGGVAYVYLIYGMHHCFNVVTGKQDEPSAVLVRAVAPLEGIEVMARRRGKALQDASPNAVPGKALVPRGLVELTSGPGRLAQAFALTREHTGTGLTGGSLFIARGRKIAEQEVAQGARVGVEYAGEDALLPYRFFVRGDPFVSRPWPQEQREAVRAVRERSLARSNHKR